MEEKKIGQRFADCYGECPATVDAYEVAARIPDHVGRDERLTFWKALDSAWLEYDAQFGIDTYRNFFATRRASTSPPVKKTVKKWRPSGRVYPARTHSGISGLSTSTGG